MADFYLDTSEIGNAYQAYADTPTTWGVPQDGNGKAGPGHSAAVAIATIDCASASASGAGQLSLLGQTVSSTLTGSGATLATNIAAAINAYATAVIATYSQALLPLNKLVYARVNPGLTTQVQVMMRIAGVDWNGMTPASAGTWGTAPTMGAFAGGANGPFAYFFNAPTVFGKTVGTYGLMFYKPGSVTEPGATDIINVRTMRSSANLTVTATTAGFSITAPTATQRNFVYDNGTVWSGDSGVFTLDFSMTTSGATNVMRLPPGIHKCASQYNFNFNVNLVGAGSSLTLSSVNSTSNVATVYQGVKFSEGGSTPTTSSGLIVSGNAGSGFAQGEFNQCWMSYAAPRVLVAGAYCSNTNTKFNKCKFSAATMSGKWTGFINATNAGSGSGEFIVEMRGCEFDATNAFKADAPVVGTLANGRIVLDSITNLDFSVAGFTPSIQFPSATFLYVDASENRQFRYESKTHIVDWQNNGAYPTLTAMLPSGVLWSQRVLWQTVISPSHTVAALKTALYYKDGDGTKTVTWEFLIPNTFSPTKADMAMMLRYQDVSGVIQHATTQYDWATLIQGTAPAVDTSTAAWASIPSGFVKRKFSVTVSLKQNTEIVATLILAGTPASQQALYFHPELAIT